MVAAVTSRSVSAMRVAMGALSPSVQSRDNHQVGAVRSRPFGHGRRAYPGYDRSELTLRAGLLWSLNASTPVELGRGFAPVLSRISELVRAPLPCATDRRAASILLQEVVRRKLASARHIGSASPFIHRNRPGSSRSVCQSRTHQKVEQPVVADRLHRRTCLSSSSSAGFKTTRKRGQIIGNAGQVGAA